ncbi:NAD(P)-dependent dehydrogenase (short-subunit alcohol dehydrogenase family) [Mycobacterium sp. BK086]|uniref:SDR family NAD(P)-dependent oxidoreductase n=1 Tax=Mycobacterium sp. BK086 TaxID=2512165 RepID=UPI00105F9EA5|nr:SDR family oxidoreductase [Mycobacterium sp. BK086]TDO14280.1 NAD(P)-dependent dehydrogenase (short-subunit alcohol dehydrogenase family) [Mycobacterium sp. BK086]
MSDRPLDGFGAVVVGGSRGIGAAVSALLAAYGAGVVVNGRDGAAAQETVDAIVAAGGRAVPHAGSGADEAVADDLITLCEKEFGAIDALVNCAGAPEPPGSSILSVTPAEFRDLLDVHVGTTFATCRAAAPKMVARGRGAIVNTSSFAFLGDYGGTGYPAGKGAVNGLTMAIAAELAEHGVRANVVCPGAKTRLSTGPDYEEQIASLRRRGLLDEVSAQGALDAPAPDYVAPMYAYLVSDLAKKITGQIFIAAGGFVGRFDRPSPSLIGYRDHNDSPPWTIDEIAEMLT